MSESSATDINGIICESGTIAGSEYPVQLSCQDIDLLQAVLKSMRQGVVCTDSEGAIIEVNEYAEGLLQIKKEKGLGSVLTDVNPPKVAEYIESIWENLKCDPSREYGITVQWDEQRWMEIRFSVLVDSKGSFNGVIVNYIDETERKKMEENHRALELKLIQEHKLSAIGILASGIAHNLNGPLSIIIGYMDLLYVRNPELEELPIILAQGERMKDIISNMMIKSRHEQDTRRKSLNLNTLLQNELKFLEANLEFKHRIEKHYEFTPSLPSIFGIYSDFSQCFLNIINNAIDAMYDANVKCLSVNTDFDKENLYVTVKDTGCGLDPEDADKLFNPFYSTKPPVGESKGGQPTGTGLGLSSAYQLIKKYNGHIVVNGAPGQGAEFKITIPINKNLPPEIGSSTKESHKPTVD